MIFDNINNIKNYKDNDLQKVFEALKNIDADNFPKDMINIKEGEIFIKPVELTSKNLEKCIYESHKEFIDIHFVVEGAEVIHTADVTSLDIDVPYDKKLDVMFLKGKESTINVLKKGDFLVCYPSDAHKVGISYKEDSKIKKIVGKIRVK